MLATICKTFKFSAAHQLPNHDGPCARPHGHNYKLEVLVTGRIKDPAPAPASDEGMVMDFARIVEAYDQHIAPKVDHRDLNAFLAVPTSELIAIWIYGVMQRELNEQPSLTGPNVCIRVWESDSSFAEVGTAPWRG